jgi:hypothetical protein
VYELFVVWRSCREDPDTIDRTRVLVLPSAEISTAVERAKYVIHWQNTFKALGRRCRQRVHDDRRDHRSCASAQRRRPPKKKTATIKPSAVPVAA